MKKLAIICASIFCVISITSCKKDPVKGCKTSFATNYNSSAEEDDGSCNYESKVIFWQNQSNASSWSALGVTALNFYVDGSFIGSCGATTYYGSVPSCSSDGLAHITKNLGSSKVKSFSYTVKDQNGTQWYSVTITLDGSACTTQQIN